MFTKLFHWEQDALTQSTPVLPSSLTDTSSVAVQQFGGFGGIGTIDGLLAASRYSGSQSYYILSHYTPPPQTITTPISSGGITFNLEFDAAASVQTTAAANFRAGIVNAAQILAGKITDKITVNISIDYSGTGGGAAAGPASGTYESYATVRNDLIATHPGDSVFSVLPNSASIQGQSSVAVWNAQLKALGFIAANSTALDGSATFNTDISSSSLVGVALHELTHALGRVPYGSAPDIFDLSRFTSNGVRLFNGNAASAPSSYFSTNGGQTAIANYATSSDTSDFSNSAGAQGASDPFNAFYNSSTNQLLSQADLKQIDALGYHLTSSAAAVAGVPASTAGNPVTNVALVHTMGVVSDPGHVGVAVTGFLV